MSMLLSHRVHHQSLFAINCQMHIYIAIQLKYIINKSSSLTVELQECNQNATVDVQIGKKTKRKTWKHWKGRGMKLCHLSEPKGSWKEATSNKANVTKGKVEKTLKVKKRWWKAKNETDNDRFSLFVHLFFWLNKKKLLQLNWKSQKPAFKLYNTLL